jgi:hypothetical protein
MTRQIMLTLACAAIFVFGALTSAPALAHPLAGKSVQVMFKEVGKKKPDKDKLVFAKGMFTSAGCTPYGFGPAPYKATKSGSSWHFTVHSKSKKEGDMYWKGTVKGKSFKGTARWVKKGQKDIRYTFAGTIK